MRTEKKAKQTNKQTNKNKNKQTKKKTIVAMVKNWFGLFNGILSYHP